MKELMFFIHKQSNSAEILAHSQHQEFLKACESYIGKLKKEGKLISAQPIEWKGKIISFANGTWKDVPFSKSSEVIGGHYHIFVNNLEEAIEIAKANPEFDYNPNTRIEVRPIKTKEESTNYVYPKA
jgi:hypothetical protein